MLKIIVNSDSHLHTGEDLSSQIEAIVQKRLGRFEDRLTRVVVHLRDEKGSKSGHNEVVCMTEARPEGMDAVNVTDRAADLLVAVNHSAHKLEKKLDETFERLRKK
ncbi:MAG: HPF/RaiA family ribosome-associated protein [Fimbriimonadaceae bacterium]|nr:HPF/RaiA family ribosome-associated protein [Fimbriimonadaceae bacterium]